MEKIYKYIEDHVTPQGDALDWVQKQTHIRTNHARMLSGALQGELMRILVQISGAKRVLELGTFTGYSAICLATHLPEDGHLDTLELNDELEDLILEGFDRAGLSEKISLHIGDCKETLKKLREDIAEPYDIVYIDANKREYCEYYDLVFDMVRSGGLILADNVLWDGKVCQDPLPQDKQTLGIARFNDMVSEDHRVESVILPLRDGLNVIRKK
jgi:predicted O-methyltransferase YrrM